MNDRYLRMPELRRIVPVSRSTIFEWINKGTFPKPHQLGERSIGWLESDVSAWMSARTAAGKL
jgi:prophage regulatory protein